MKNGFMASDVGDPKVVVTESIEVNTLHTKDTYKDDKLCRYQVEDTFKYDNKKMAFIKSKGKARTTSECADE